MDKVNNSIRAADPNAFKASPARKNRASGESNFAEELLQAGAMGAVGVSPQADVKPVTKTGEQGSEEQSQKGEERELVSIQSTKAGGKEGGAAYGVNQDGSLLMATAEKGAALDPVAMNALAQQQQALRETKNALATNAEKSPFSLKSAASLNTANAIAGLKPWSNDWVFEGRPNAVGASEIQPLFGDSQPVQAPGTQVLRTRGEAEGASQNTKVPTEATAADRSEANQALAAQFTQYLQEGLEAQLQALGGESRPSMGNTSLSGSEFLSTLAAIRGAQQDAARGDAQGQQQQGSGNKDRKSDLGPQLRVIEGGSKNRKIGFEHDLMSARSEALSPTAGHQGAVAAKPAALTGHVTKGAMSQDRLSSESLSGLSAGIRNLTSQGGGEIRVRLNPENLGELHIRVMTQGNQVGLQIQASDEKARKVIEDSMSHLKESMAANHLALGQVDLSVGNARQSAMNGESRQEQGQNQSQQQSFLGDPSGQNRGQNSWNGGSGSDRWSAVDSRGQPQASVSASAMGTGAMAARSVSSNGRIDVRA